MKFNWNPALFSEAVRQGARGLMLLLAFVIGSSACANRKPAVLIGQSGVVAVESIGTISDAVVALNLPREKELVIQKALFKANENLAPVPGLIIAIDNATKAGEQATNEVDKALAYLAEGARWLDSVSTNPDIKAAATAIAVIKLVQEVQLTVTRAQQAIEKLKQPVPKTSLLQHQRALETVLAN